MHAGEVERAAGALGEVEHLDPHDLSGFIVVEEDVLDSVNIFGDTPSESIGVVKELFTTATDFGVPIYDLDRNKVWSPE